VGFVCGISSTIQSVNRVVGEIAGTTIPVHLTGESGTGREVYARVIHRLSPGRNVPLKKHCCSILEPNQLVTQLNSSLRETGGAHSNDVGTVYLDGIDELDVACQRVLLSILSDEGGEGCQNSRVRLLSSASRPMDRAMESGRFRRELFFRINGINLRLPPLRERLQDLPPLFGFFLSKHAAELGKRAPVPSQSELGLLQSYEWPGNIRELGNLARRIVATGDTKVAIAELHSAAGSASNVRTWASESSLKVAARAAARQAERELILRTLERTHWNRKRAAQDLQISYKSLLYKIKQTGVLDNHRGQE